MLRGSGATTRLHCSARRSELWPLLQPERDGGAIGVD
jgi:hypothetical protein